MSKFFFLIIQIVQMRNEVVDCLEMDRLREAEEDMVCIKFLKKLKSDYKIHFFFQSFLPEHQTKHRRKGSQPTEAW